MKNLNKQLLEIVKFSILFFVTLLCVVCFVLFCFKLPSSDDYGGIPVDKHPIYTIVESNHTYTQEFTSTVSKLKSVSILFNRNYEQKLSGIVKMEVFNKNGESIGSYEYDVDMIPPTNYVMVPVNYQENSYGQTYRLVISFYDLDNTDELRIAYVKNNKEIPYQLNDVRQKNPLVISYVGQKGDKSFFWYPIMGIAILIPLFVMIDYKKIKNWRGKNEK